MIKEHIKYIVFTLFTTFLLSACTTSTKMISVKDEKTGKIKIVAVVEQIEVKLMNDYEEVYNIEDVIIGYKAKGFNPFDGKVIADEFKSTNKEFNSLYSDFSKNGEKKDLLENKYMTFLDDGILGILAKEYGMKVVILNKETNKIEELDYKKIDINFSKKEKYNLYSGFEKTIKHYQKQLKSK